MKRHPPKGAPVRPAPGIRPPTTNAGASPVPPVVPETPDVSPTTDTSSPSEDSHDALDQHAGREDPLLSDDSSDVSSDVSSEEDTTSAGGDALSQQPPTLPGDPPPDIMALTPAQAIAAALQMPGAMVASAAAWLPSSRYNRAVPAVVRFMALSNFRHGGVPQHRGQPLNAPDIDARTLRLLCMGRFVVCDVLVATPPTDHY